VELSTAVLVNKRYELVKKATKVLLELFRIFVAFFVVGEEQVVPVKGKIIFTKKENGPEHRIVLEEGNFE
jgi:hypothetical protein